MEIPERFRFVRPHRYLTESFDERSATVCLPFESSVPPEQQFEPFVQQQISENVPTERDATLTEEETRVLASQKLLETSTEHSSPDNSLDFTRKQGQTHVEVQFVPHERENYLP